jgi:cytoskeleton protein RodZ
MVSEPGAVDKTKAVGSFLRNSRESQGLSLNEASRVTRISTMYLSALEEERFDILPNPAYARGFLRAYARFLGLSGDEIIDLFERGDSPASQEPPLQTEKAQSRSTGSTREYRQRRLVVIMLLLALVLAAAYFFREKEKIQETPPVASTVPAPALPAPLQQNRSSAVRPAAVPAASTEKPAGETVPSENEPLPAGIVLKLKIIQDSSLNITIDGMISQQYELKAGDLIEWKADKVIALDMGNAGGVEAELNGRRLKPFGERGTPAHVVLTADAPSP